jgi:acetolactate synthase-1/2/3 large subunit
MGMLGAGPGDVKRPGPAGLVCCIIGDGAMGFHSQEVETAVRHRLPIVWLVLADRQWGMVKMNQSFALRPLKMLVRKRLDPGENIWSDLGEIRFDDLARSMGAHGDRVADPALLPAALDRALAAGGPAVLHIDVNRWPTVGPGAGAFKDMPRTQRTVASGCDPATDPAAERLPQGMKWTRSASPTPARSATNADSFLIMRLSARCR